LSVSVYRKKWVCNVCGYIYDPIQGDSKDGITEGIEFEDLPEDWRCPDCGASKNQFELMDEEQDTR